MHLLVSIILFVSATLLFWVQPLFGKMSLPLLGGTPAVWNTCLVFFQAVLLLGYMYAHLTGVLLKLRQQIVLHLALLTVFFVFLPVKIPEGWTPPALGNPVPWLLLLLTVSLGYPFLLLSATAPLLQKWFSLSDDSRAKDPYFLYAASNAGSILGLLGYPLLVEPRLTLSQQSWVWSAVYGAFFLCTAAFAALLWRRGSDEGGAGEESPTDERPLPRLRWIVLAFVPSSLLQSVTTSITTDLAAVPLLWVLPLVLYMGSFIFVFSRRQVIPPNLMIKALPLVLTALVVLHFWCPGKAFFAVLFLNGAVLFVTAMVCHGELVRLRPATRYLTEFYMLMSLGGVLGGVFNAILAPMIFNAVYEYPISLVLAALMLPQMSDPANEQAAKRFDILLPVAMGAVLGLLLWIASSVGSEALSLPVLATVGGLAGLVTYFFRKRPLRYGLGTAVLIVAGIAITLIGSHSYRVAEYQHRNFFGVVKVYRYRSVNATVLYHNTTIHGLQFHDDKYRRIPSSYFSTKGPIGDLFTCLAPTPKGRNVAVVGLGAGVLAAYGAPGEHWTFYEINEDIARVASSTGHFSYLSDSPARVDVILGDARLSLADAPKGSFDLMLLDAFSSDSLPVHLVTREALKLYLSKLAPQGLLVFNITNRHLDLVPLFHSLAKELHLVGVQRLHIVKKLSEGMSPFLTSHWVVLARSKDDLRCLTEKPGWRSLTDSTSPATSRRPWTDDFSNLLEYLRIFQKSPQGPGSTR